MLCLTLSDVISFAVQPTERSICHPHPTLDFIPLHDVDADPGNIMNYESIVDEVKFDTRWTQILGHNLGIRRQNKVVCLR
jgi:hypothetical protein